MRDEYASKAIRLQISASEQENAVQQTKTGVHARRKGLESAGTADAKAEAQVDAYIDAYVDAQAHARTTHHHGDY